MLIDGTFGSLDDDVLDVVKGVFEEELKATGVIHIGGPGEAASAVLDRAAPGQIAAGRHRAAPRGGAERVGPGGLDREARATGGTPMSLPRRLALLLMAAIAFASPRWGGAQSFEFHAPLSASDAKTPAVMRDLAERLLPVYQESDPDRYLANLSVLQLTAGDYSAAVESRGSLRERRRRADSGRPVVRGRVLDLYARAMAIETDSHVPFSEAFGEGLPRGVLEAERPRRVPPVGMALRRTSGVPGKFPAAAR